MLPIYKDSTHEVELAPSRKLAQLAKRLREREDAMEKLGGQAKETAHALLIEAKLQGEDLLSAKAELKHGEWLDWLKAHSPKSVQTASVYMRIAQHWEQLNEASSLRAALHLLAALNSESIQPIQQQKEHTPGRLYLSALTGAARIIKVVVKYPVAEWPQAGREELKRQLAPLATQLWPERFASAAPTAHPNTIHNQQHGVGPSPGVGGTGFQTGRGVQG